MAESEIETSGNSVHDGILGLPGEGVEAAALSVRIELIGALECGVKAGESEKNWDIIFEVGDDRTGIVGEGFGIDGGGDGESIKICHIGIDNNDCGHFLSLSQSRSFYRLRIGLLLYPTIIFWGVKRETKVKEPKENRVKV